MAYSGQTHIKIPNDLFGNATLDDYELMRQRRENLQSADKDLANKRNPPVRCRLCPPSDQRLFKGSGPAKTHRYQSEKHQIAQGLLFEIPGYIWTLAALQSINVDEAAGRGCLLCAVQYPLLSDSVKVDGGLVNNHVTSWNHRTLLALAATQVEPKDLDTLVSSPDVKITKAGHQKHRQGKLPRGKKRAISSSEESSGEQQEVESEVRKGQKPAYKAASKKYSIHLG